MDKLIKIFSILWLLFTFFPDVINSQGLNIKTGATLINRGNLILKGNWVNDGAFSDTSANVIFSGTNQTIEGSVPSAFNNMTISSGSSTVIISSGQTLQRILLCDGTLEAGGNLTLLSTVTSTGLIDGMGTGQITGNLTMQRYLPSGFGYKYLSSPFQGATVNEFGDDMNLLSTFPAFYKYDENMVSSGWIKYIDPAGVLNPMQGYAINFGTVAAARVADVSGVVSNGAVSLTLYNNNHPYTLGFNLVGNPYPSPINWNSVSGWNKINIDNALYYYKAGGSDQYTGTYSSFVNGISSDGFATNIIPSMQAFFIHISDGSWPVTGTLSMDNNVRINNLSHPLIKGGGSSERLFMRLSTHFQNDPASLDPMVVYFDEKAHSGFEGELDALKIMNTDLLVPNLYSFSSDGSKLSINALPVSDDSLIVIPLGLKTAQGGVVIFKLNDTTSLLSGINIYINDNEAFINNNLTLSGGYKVYLVAGEYNKRFSLRIMKGTADVIDVKPTIELFKIYNSNGTLKADFKSFSAKTGRLIIFNITGQLVFSKEIYEGGYQEFNPQLRNGIYIVSFVTGNMKDTKKILILNK